MCHPIDGQNQGISFVRASSDQLYHCNLCVVFCVGLRVFRRQEQFSVFPPERNRCELLPDSHKSPGNPKSGLVGGINQVSQCPIHLRSAILVNRLFLCLKALLFPCMEILLVVCRKGNLPEGNASHLEPHVVENTDMLVTAASPIEENILRRTLMLLHEVNDHLGYL